MQTEIASVSWIVIFILAGIGTSLLRIGFKAVKSNKVDQKDALSVAYSELFAIIAGCGFFLLFAVFFIATIKIATPSP